MRGVILIQDCAGVRHEAFLGDHAEDVLRGVPEAQFHRDGDIRWRTQLLERNTDARFTCRSRVAVLKHLTIDGDGALIGCDHTRKHLHEGRLASAVFSKETVNFSAAQRETHSLKGTGGAEVFTDILDIDEGHTASFLWSGRIIRFGRCPERFQGSG